MVTGLQTQPVESMRCDGTEMEDVMVQTRQQTTTTTTLPLSSEAAVLIPFMAKANDRKIDSYKSSTPAKLLPEERNIFYFKRYTRSCPVGKGRKRTCKTKKRKNQTRK